MGLNGKHPCGVVTPGDPFREEAFIREGTVPQACLKAGLRK